MTRATALRDAFAGIQLAAMNIPQCLGYARIAGTPLVTGLYTLLLPPAGFAAFGSSRYLVVAADSATAAIIAGGLAPLAAWGSGRYVALASLVALMTAGLLLAARLLKLGFLADFLSQTVLVGFLTGVGIQVGIAVLGEMSGIAVPAQGTLGQAVEVLRGLPRLHPLTLLVSALVLALIFGSQRYAPRVPGPLVAVLAAIWASAAFHLPERGVRVVGAVTGGLPHLGLPAVGWGDVGPLVALSASCLVVIVAQSAATARAYAMRRNEFLSENADLLGLCVANVAAGLSGAFVVNGSPTQTAMVETAGGRSQLAQLTTAGVVALVLVFVTGPLEYLPQAALGSIVFVIAVRLIDLKGLRDIRRESPGEFWVAAMTAGVVVAVGVEQGIVLAMVVSLLRVVGHTYHPHTGVLARSEQGGWHTLPAEAGRETERGLTIYRFGAPLFYANASLFSKEILRLAGGEHSDLRWVVVDSEAMTHIDYSAARVVCELSRDLASRGITIAFARVSPELEADLERHHIRESLGPGRVFARLHDALRAFGEFRHTPEADATGR